MNQKEAYEQGKANGYQAASYLDDEAITDASDEMNYGDPDVLDKDELEEVAQAAAYAGEQNAREYSGFAGFAAEINNGPESRFEGLWEKYEEGVSVGIRAGVKEWLEDQPIQNPADLPSRAADLAEAWKHSHAELLKGRIGSLEASKERRYILRMAEDEGVLDEVMGLIGKRKNPRKLRKRIPKRIEIAGTRWQDSHGNTYHISRIYFNDKLVYESPITYGYGSQYQETAYKWLREDGYAPVDAGSWEIMKHLTEKHKSRLIERVEDVSRKRDL